MTNAWLTHQVNGGRLSTTNSPQVIIDLNPPELEIEGQGPNPVELVPGVLWGYPKFFTPDEGISEYRFIGHWENLDGPTSEAVRAALGSELTRWIETLQVNWRSPVEKRKVELHNPLPVLTA